MRHLRFICLAWFELQAVLWFKIGNVAAIVGGQPAAVDQFRYMVSVQGDGKHICSGAIVSNAHVITAAHCFIGEDGKFINKQYTVLGRVTNLISNEVPPIQQDVHAVFAPKDYVGTPEKKRVVLPRPGNNFYQEIGDIAIVKLKGELPLNNYLSALRLPSRAGQHNLRKYTHLDAILTGYGIDIDPHRGVKRDRNSTATTSNVSLRLNFIETTVQHKNEIKNMVPYFVHDRYLISWVKKRSSDERKGACTGDDGAPLVFDDTLIGVLAQYWPDCNESVFGSAYTRVSYYLQYIKESIKGIRGRDGRLAMYRESRSASGQIVRNFEERR